MEYNKEEILSLIPDNIERVLIRLYNKMTSTSTNQTSEFIDEFKPNEQYICTDNLVDYQTDYISFLIKLSDPNNIYQIKYNGMILSNKYYNIITISRDNEKLYICDIEFKIVKSYDISKYINNIQPIEFYRELYYEKWIVKRKRDRDGIHPYVPGKCSYTRTIRCRYDYLGYHWYKNNIHICNEFFKSKRKR